MDELASLKLRVDSLEIAKAQTRLGRLTDSGARAERATDRLSSAFKRIAGPAAVFAGAVLSLRKLTDVTREFDVLNAQLLTATGSAEGAAVAFEAIQDFASTTPFDLQQVTKGFVQLVNLGLTPSERALTSYGDTASAMGKDLNQLIEAVADAATGEFERLKEFGIKARSEGDNVSFTFRGITTTVRKSAAEIEEYLINLGENDFAGAMLNRVNSLDGALSNLGDEWDKLWLNISQQGIGDAIEDTVRLGIGALQELNDQLASGELEGYIAAVGSKFDGVGADITDTLDILTKLFNDAAISWSGDGTQAAFNIRDSFGNLPENLRAIVKILAVELGFFADQGLIYGAQFKDNVVLKFQELVATAKVYAVAVREAFTPFSSNEYDLASELEAVDARFKSLADKASAEVQARLAAIREARFDTIDGILAERNAAVKSFSDQIAASKNLREEYEKQKAARAEAGGDRLAGFKVGGSDEGSSETDAEKKAREKAEKAAEAERKANERALARLEDYLLTEEEMIQQSYDRRLILILNNTEEGSAKQLEMIQKLNARMSEELAGIQQESSDDMSEFGKQAARNIQDQFGDTVERTLRGNFDGILSDWGNMLARMGSQAIAARLAESFGLTDILSGGGGKSKGGGIVGSIGGFLGFKDSGGSVGPGQYAIAGERRPEIVMGPATIVGGDQTSKMMGGGNVINISVNGSGGERENRKAAGEVARQVKKALSEAGRY